jgi:hypothetical protein
MPQEGDSNPLLLPPPFYLVPIPSSFKKWDPILIPIPKLNENQAPIIESTWVIGQDYFKP